MRVRAVVSSVKTLPARDAGDSSKGLTSVSLEGFGVLAGDDVKPLPAAGQEIDAVVTVQWREKGSRPLHWLRSFQAAV